MKSMKRVIKRLAGRIDAAAHSPFGGSAVSGDFRNPRRYRLDFINERTFNRVWTIRFSRVRVILFFLTVVAAIAALVFVILFYTPVRRLMPGQLDGDLRSRYIDMALSLDSLEQEARINDAYLTNIGDILMGRVDPDSTRESIAAGMLVASADTLIAASEAERRFVKSYEDAERFNLSVLTPIAAEGMTFYSPVPGVISEPRHNETATAVTFDEKMLLPVSSVYRGTVIGIYAGQADTRTVIVQHPNDFISVYGGLREVFAAVGDKVSAGQRIGHSGEGKCFSFELWHNGSATDPTDYIGF